MSSQVYLHYVKTCKTDIQRDTRNNLTDLRPFWYTFDLKLYPSRIFPYLHKRQKQTLIYVKKHFLPSKISLNHKCIMQSIRRMVKLRLIFCLVHMWLHQVWSRAHKRQNISKCSRYEECVHVCDGEQITIMRTCRAQEVSLCSLASALPPGISWASSDMLLMKALKDNSSC